MFSEFCDKFCDIFMILFLEKQYVMSGSVVNVQYISSVYSLDLPSTILDCQVYQWPDIQTAGNKCG